MRTNATHSTTFDAKIRDQWIVAEAQAWADSEGFYKTEVTGVYIDGVNVTGLLTDFDMSELNGMVEGAIAQDLINDIGK